MAVATEPGGLGRHECRVASVPAVRDDDDHARRPKRTSGPLLVEGPERFADARAAGPVIDRIRDAAQRTVAIPVAQQASDACQARPEDERFGANLRCGGKGLHEAQQQPRMALHGARDVAQDHERARLADRPPPDPFQELPAGPQVLPEHRPRRESPAVRVELVATGAPPLQPGHEGVHQALRLTQLRRSHPVELTVPQDLPLRVRVRRDDDTLDRRLVLVRIALGRDGGPALLGLHLAPLRAGLRRGRPRGLFLEGGIVVLAQRGRLELAREG